APRVTAATLTSLQTEPVQKIVDVGKVHHHLAGFRALVAADHAVLGELVDDATGTRIPDVELALHQRHRGRTLRRDGASSAREQRIELALGGLASLPLRAGPLFEDLLHIARAALRAPEVDDRLHFGIADERALDPSRFTRVDRLVQHVATTQQLLRAARVEDDAAVDLRADRERDARRDVGLDETGDDVRGRPLRGDHEMNAHGTRQLCDATDELFD